MLARFRAGHIVRPPTIDEIVTRSEENRKAREAREEARRIDLSRKLGDRAVNGETFGIKGFMAIGFPKLVPGSKEYQEVVDACHAMQRIKSGAYVGIRHDKHNTDVIGVKADAGDKGLAFEARLTGDDVYEVSAVVLCARALYTHHSPDRATMHGTDESPYPVGFIYPDMNIARIKAVDEIILGDDGLDHASAHYADGAKVLFSAGYTQRIAADLQPEPAIA